MKKLLSFLCLFICAPAFAAAIEDNCTRNGIALHGRVQVVDYFADFKVQKVDYFADLKVQRVNYFPDSCGEWQFVDAFPDFTIQFVDYFPDFTVQFVDYFPGM